MPNNDLISRAAAIDYLMTNMGWHDADGYEVDDADEKRAIITDLVNGIPAVDAAPVRHGRWEEKMEHAGYVCCSVCHDCYVEKGWIFNKKWAWCPQCGARLKED